MHIFFIVGESCRIAGWGAVNHDQDNLTFESGLKELKVKPVMKSKKCILRTFFRDFDPDSKIWWKYQILEMLKKYKLIRKFQFCIDIKQGSLEGPGKVICLYRDKWLFITYIGFDLG